jgi:hypothetical protein
MPTTISVALDGSKRRDIRLAQGDEATLAVVVYEHDGDTTPIAVTGARFVTSEGAPTFTYGTEFVVPDDSVGRTWYRLVGEIAGVTTTLAMGYVFVEGETQGWPYGMPPDGYWINP